MKTKNLRSYYPLLGALASAIIFKTWLIVSGAVPFNGEEAIVSLMAKHILQGERPFFFYGQAYMGSLDAWLIAAGFKLFGEGVLAVRIVQSSLYIFFLITLWWLVNAFFKDRLIANITVWLAAIPPVVMTTYTTATLGGYGESLVLGNLVLLLGFLVLEGEGKANRWIWLALGLAGGVGFWVLGVAGVYILPIAVLGIWRYKLEKPLEFGLAGLGFFIGSGAWWLYNLQNNWAAVFALKGHDLVDVGTTWLDRLAGMLLLGVPAMIGLRMPWSPEFFPVAMLLIGLVIYLGVAAYKLRIAKDGETNFRPWAGHILSIFVIVFTLIFVFTPYGIDATGRYLLPLYIVIVLAAAELVAAAWRRKTVWGIGLAVVIILFNLSGNIIAANGPDKITTQFNPITSYDNSYDEELMAFLRENGELRGYTNYFVSYRLAFISGEEIIFSPEIPYREDLLYTPKANRYPLYAKSADGSDRTAYITTKHPILDEYLREKFKELGVGFQEHQIGPFHIFYDLTRAVRPEEVGFGEAVQ